MTALPMGKGEILQRGKGIAILAFGSMVTPAMEAARHYGSTLANMRFIKPLDEALILELAKNHQAIVTVEENAVQGGVGGAIDELLAKHGVMIPTLNLGIPDQFIAHGSREECLAECGLDTSGIIQAVATNLQNFACQPSHSTLAF